MAFPVDRVLGVSLSEYCVCKNLHPTYYELIGVVKEGEDLNRFLEAVPSNAEAVVNFRVSMASVPGTNGDGDIARNYSGTALILKSRSRDGRKR